MATENPMRIMESNGGGNWTPSRGTTAFTSSVTSQVSDELGLLLRGHNIHRDRRNIAPHRSGSAPPSMEGSFAAFGNLMKHQHLGGGRLEDSGMYYGRLNSDANPRIPRGSGYMYAPGSSLSTHEEEPEEVKSPGGGSDDRSNVVPGQNVFAFGGRHKSLVDLIQEDFPRTPSPVFSKNRSSSHVEEPYDPDTPSLTLDSLSLEASNSPEPKSNDINSSLDTSARARSSQKDESSRKDADFSTDGGTVHQESHAKINSIEMQPLRHAPNIPPPLYATTAAYMAPGNAFYGNYNTSGLYTPPQYSGYAMGSSILPPYLSGYPSPTFPLDFNANSESISKGPVVNRFYGHPTTIPDPLSMQYFQQDPYGVHVPYSHLPSPSMMSNQVDPFALRSDHRSVPGPGFVPRFPTSPLGSPVMPESPVGGVTSLGRHYDIGFSQSPVRNVGGYARWQGQRGADGFSDHGKHSFLEELKGSNARRLDLSDIIGRIVEFSVDQHGSRFIQQKLENCSVEEKESVFKEVLLHSSQLITDVFGNYVIQKFFEHGTNEQRKKLASQLSGQMLSLSLQMYGCRVIQKALEVIEIGQKTELVLELDGHVMRCVRDQNGNHVIQKCIECVPVEKINFIITAFRGQVAVLSTHPYGCRVIQRVLEHCSDDIRCRTVVDEILESAYDLAHDQYGNYVTQHVLERGKPFERSQILSKFSGKIVQMSQHKYASNVVEKCLAFGDAVEQERLIEEILVQSEDNDSLLGMMKDQFANYVVQKILDISAGNQKATLLDRIRLHLIALKKYTYGKHIVARFEQLVGEDDSNSEP